MPDPAEARALVGPCTRAIVLVSPNNPTGATYPAAVLAEFAVLAREAGIALVVDQTYPDVLPDGLERPHALLTAPDWRDTVVHVHSFSKSCAIPGHRLGAVTAGRQPFGVSAEAAAARLAAEGGIVVLPGSFFGPGQDDHLRFAFANVDDRQITALSARQAAVPTGATS